MATERALLKKGLRISLDRGAPTFRSKAVDGAAVVPSAVGSSLYGEVGNCGQRSSSLPESSELSDVAIAVDLVADVAWNAVW